MDLIFPAFLGVFHGFPRAGHVAVGLMNQIQVHVVEAQLFQGRIDALAGGVVAVVLKPELAGDEYFVTGDAAVTDGPANFVFIEIGRRCVDVAVAEMQGLRHGVIGAAVVGNEKYAEADGGDSISIT